MSAEQTQSKAETNNKQSVSEVNSKARRKERKRNSLPMSVGDEVFVGAYPFRVGAYVSWNDMEGLPTGALFSPSKRGILPFQRLSKSSYSDLITGETTTGVQDSGKVYRIYLSPAKE